MHRQADGVATSSLSRAGTVGGLVLFITIGATLGLYGPAIPTLREVFQLSAGDSGLLLSVHFAGAMVGILGWVVLARWSKDRTLLRSAIILLGIGAGGVALASRWLVVLAAAAIIGLGFGVLVVAVSMLFATGFGIAVRPC